MQKRRMIMHAASAASSAFCLFSSAAGASARERATEQAVPGHPLLGNTPSAQQLSVPRLQVPRAIA
jgi:hypothetical protein